MEIIWDGPPGDSWLNDTGDVAWQFFCSFDNSCSICIDLHGTVSDEPFPIPIHDNCNCYQEEIFPGESSDPFVDVAAYIDSMSPDRQAAIIGKSHERLIR